MFPERFDKIIKFLPNGQTATYTKGAGLQGITYLRNGETYVFISSNDDDNIVCDGVVATTTTTTTSTTTTTTTTTTAAPTTSLSFRNIVGDNGCNGSISEFPKCIPCSPTSSSHVVKTKEEDGVITFKVSVSVTNPNTSELWYIWEYKSYTTECSSGDWTRFGTSNSSANQYGVTTVPTVDFNYNCVAGQSLRLEVRCQALMGNENTRTFSNSYYYKCDNQIDTSEFVNKFDLLISTPENASEASPEGFTTVTRGFALADLQYNSETQQCEYQAGGESLHVLNTPSDRLDDRNLIQLPFSESTKEAIRQIGKVSWLIRRPSYESLVDDTPSTSIASVPNDQRSFQTLPSTTALSNDNDPTTLSLTSVNFTSMYLGAYEIVAKVEIGTETYYSKIVPVFLKHFSRSQQELRFIEDNLLSLGDRSYEKFCIQSHPNTAGNITADVAIIDNNKKQNVYIASRLGERSYGALAQIFPTDSVYIDGEYVTRNNLKVVQNVTYNSLSYLNSYFIQEVDNIGDTNVLVSGATLSNSTSIWGFYNPKSAMCAFARYYPYNSITPWNNGVIAPLSRSNYSSSASGSYPAQISDLVGGNTLTINLKDVTYYHTISSDLEKAAAPDLVVYPYIEFSNDGGGTWRLGGGLISVVKKNNHWQATFRNSYSFGSRNYDLLGWRSGTLIRYTPTGIAGVYGGFFNGDTYYPGLARRQLTDPSIPINFYPSNSNNTPFSQPYSIP